VSICGVDHPLHWFRRLRIRWEIRDDIREAFLRLTCAIIFLRRLTSLSPCQEFPFRAFGGRIDRNARPLTRRVPQGQYAPTWRTTAGDRLAACTDVPAGREH
jgi:hypothetical protein